LSGQQYYPGSFWPAAGQPAVLASDADRDRAAELLSAAFAEGRLTAGEHGDRVRAAYAARTWRQLRQLTHDLPALDHAATGRDVAAGPDWCLLCLLLVVCPPAGIAWLWLSWRRARACPGTVVAPAGGLDLVDATRAGRPGLWQETGHAQDR
jgi:uncharacterized protein DUF1707